MDSKISKNLKMDFAFLYYTGQSSLDMDSSVPLTHHDPKDLGLICLGKKRKIYFRILSDFRIQSWIFVGQAPDLPVAHDR